MWPSHEAPGSDPTTSGFGEANASEPKKRRAEGEGSAIPTKG